MYKEFLQYILKCDPRIKERDIYEIAEINDMDLIIILKDGRRFYVDRITGYHREAFYGGIEELTDEQEKREFGRLLRRMMRYKGVTQEELAKRVNTSQTMISHYMLGHNVPNMIMGRKLAKALDCSLDELFYVNYNKIIKVWKGE